MAHKYLKSCSKSLRIRHKLMQQKTGTNEHNSKLLVYTRWTGKHGKLDKVKCSPGCGEPGTRAHHWWGID